MILLQVQGREAAVIEGDINSWGSIEDYENQHGGYGFGVSNMEEESVLEFCAAMNMTVGIMFNVVLFLYLGVKCKAFFIRLCLLKVQRLLAEKR